MIIVKLMGGLGNQLFQYAAARIVAHLNQTKLKLDLSFLLDRSPRVNFTYRDYDLDGFNINAEILTETERQEFINDSNHCIFSENLVSPFQKCIFKNHSNIYLDGYWQSEKYFVQHENIIRRELTFNKPLDPLCENLNNLIQKENSVCIHIRRGDYITNPNANKTHGVLTENYFYQAVGKISSYIQDPQLVVFSDDIDWCIHNLKFDYPTLFITKHIGGNNFKSHFQMMTYFKYYIISNSTFSWWAAWLSKCQDKIIIAPHEWFRDNTIDTSDLIPETWIKI